MLFAKNKNTFVDNEIKPSYQYIHNEYQYLIFQGRKVYRRKISRKNNTINFGNWEEYPMSQMAKES